MNRSLTALLIATALYGQIPQLSAQTMVLRSSYDSEIINPLEPSKKREAKIKDLEVSDLLLKAEKLRAESNPDLQSNQILQNELKELRNKVAQLSTLQKQNGDSVVGKVAIGEWELKPIEHGDLQTAMKYWRKQAEEQTGLEIHFNWKVSGEVPFEAPAIFYGTWRDALFQLALMFEDRGWPIKIEIEKINNVVRFLEIAK